MELYNITINGKESYTKLTQTEYFDVMEDLALEYYQNGTPNPSDIQTNIIEEN